jgi:hypothetical protein
MKKIQLAIIVFIGALAATGLSACHFRCVHGSGNMVSQDRKVGDFTRISIAGGYKVTLKQDSTYGIRITGDDNLLKYIKTELQGDKLKIYSKKNFCSRGPMLITIGIGNLSELKASGGIEIDSDGQIKANDIAFDLSGATKIRIDLNAANVTTSGSGATELNLKGQATSHNIELSGSGHVNALDFVVGNCEIETSGVGESKVNVLHTLSIHSSGASSVKYKGNPTITNDKSGVSSVEKID